MSDSPTASKSAPTTTPRNTHVEVLHVPGEGVMLYRPEDNAIVALYPDEWLACRAEAHENKTAIEELQEANRAVTEKSLALHRLLQQPNAAKADIAQARRELDAALDLVAQKSDAAKKRIEIIANQRSDPNKLVELLPLTLNRIEGKTNTPIYVPAQRLKKALADKRIYLVEGEAERRKRPEEKLFDGKNFNVKEIRKRIASQVVDQARFEKKWKLAPNDADQYGGILTDWARVMGTTATACLERAQKELAEGIVGADQADQANAYRKVDLKSEAQFLRWSAGAGAEANFKLLQGDTDDPRDKNVMQRAKRAARSVQSNIKANAEASFAVGEAKVATSLYLPHAAGWNLRTGDTSQSLNLGYFRMRSDLTLYALAGASIALEAGASLMLTGHRQGLKGVPKKRTSTSTKTGAEGEVKVFAGLKEGLEFSGALQWLNPEGFIDPSGPRKVDANKAIAQYVDMASVGVDAAFIQGLAASAGFECEYRDGNFVIAAHASKCIGLGGEGKIAAKVGTSQISQFLMFVAHQLKQADYKKIAFLMNEASFYLINQILYLNVLAGDKIESFVGKQATSIRTIYNEATRKIAQFGAESIIDLEKHLKSGWGWQAYMPPEARGAVIASVANVVQESNNIELRKAAAFSVNELMATIQTSGHFFNTIDRITLNIGGKTGRNEGVRIIDSIIKNTIFDGCLNRCEMQMQKANPLIGRPFLRNDYPEFQLAKFPLHHPYYY